MTKGQTIVEYIVMIGIVAAVLYTMGPTFKRGVQSLIKGTADQLAAQNTSDQDFSYGSSHLDNSFSSTITNNQRKAQELIYTSSVQVDERADTYSNSITNAVFTRQ